MYRRASERTSGTSAHHHRCGTRSSATIIEHHVAHGDIAPLNNSNTHISLARDAQLEHYRVYSTSAAHPFGLARHPSGSRRQCRQFTITLGGGLVRSSLEARLNEPGASLDSYSLLVGHADRHVDCVNIVTHAAPDTRSRQTARAIASDVSASSSIARSSSMRVRSIPIRSNLAAACCCRPLRKSIRGTA